jgi:TyrR family helix-turn-helix protein
MTEHFLARYNKEYQVQRRVSPDTILKLQTYKFPGNVRELQNIIKNAVVLSEMDLLDEILSDNIGVGQKNSAPGQRSMVDMQYPIRLRDKLERVEAEILSDACGRFRSTRQIAQNLGTSQSSVMRKINKYNLNQNNLNRK